MTPADLAALAAAGLTRYAEGRLADRHALATITYAASVELLDSAPATYRGRYPDDILDAVARLKRELRR